MTIAIDEFVSRVDKLEERISVLEMLVNNKSIDSEKNEKKKLSIKEFVLLKRPKNDVQKTLVLAYYIEKYENMTSFNADDLLNFFTRSKELKPANVNDKVNMCIKQGYMDNASEKKNGFKAWYLTNSGELIVEKGFGKQ